MPTFTKTAEDVINAVIQDGQVQTTNRTALLDYVNRTSLRMLRESQWAFLQSGYQRFITKLGVDKYWIGPGATPAGCSNTNLALTDLESVLPDSVYDLTNVRPLSQDASNVRFTLPFMQRDGSTRLGPPRGYAYYQPDPGVIHIFPPPDNQNQYYPIPQPSACANVVGGVLPGRNYFIETTFVDSSGGESTPSQPFQQYVPAGSLCLVNSPQAEVPSALSPTYNLWNVYVGVSESGPFYKQNSTPLPIGGVWVESSSGAAPVSTLATQFFVASPDGVLYSVTVDTSGILSATPANFNLQPYLIYLLDPFNQVWNLTINNMGQLDATLLPFVQASSNFVVADTSGEAWQITVNAEGQLVTLDVGPASAFTSDNVTPPTTTSLTPLDGYVIAFRYQQVKKLITDPTDTLQIPDAYFDVVVAGVNYYANLYTAKNDDENFKAPAWKKEFMDGLAQIRRDLRINYRNSDFISPDKTTQWDQYRSVWQYVW